MQMRLVCCVDENEGTCRFQDNAIEGYLGQLTDRAAVLYKYAGTLKDKLNAAS